MKCHVCRTKIPLGENVCPHCGAKIERKSLHKNHIQFISSKSINSQKIKKILFIMIAIVIALVGMSDFLRYEKKEQIRKSHETTELSFTQLMDKEVYKNNKEILILAQESLEDMTQFLKDNHITNENDISYTKRIGYSIVAVARLEFEKDNILYDIHKSFASDDTFDESIGFSIEFNNLEGIEKETFLPKDEIDLIAHYLKIDDVYEDFNEARVRILKEDSESINYTSHNKDITVNKSFDEESKLTSLLFSICQKQKE